MHNSSLIQALEATAPVCATVLTTMLSSTLGLALPPPPRPHPFCVYNFKVPNGVRFPRCIFCGNLNGVRFPRCIFCGNQNGVRFPRCIFCGNQVPAKHWRIPAPHYFAGIRIPAKHGGIPALHFLREKRSSGAPQSFQKITEGFQRPIILRESGFQRNTKGFQRCIFCGRNVPASHLQIPENHLRIPAPHYFAGVRIPARRWRIPAPHFFAGKSSDERYDGVIATITSS